MLGHFNFVLAIKAEANEMYIQRKWFYMFYT